MKMSIESVCFQCRPYPQQYPPEAPCPVFSEMTCFFWCKGGNFSGGWSGKGGHASTSKQPLSTVQVHGVWKFPCRVGSLHVEAPTLQLLEIFLNNCSLLSTSLTVLFLKLFSKMLGHLGWSSTCPSSLSYLSTLCILPLLRVDFLNFILHTCY